MSWLSDRLAWPSLTGIGTGGLAASVLSLPSEGAPSAGQEPPVQAESKHAMPLQIDF